MNAVIMIAPFPPPYGGAAKNSERLARRIGAYAFVHRLVTSTTKLSHNRSFIYHVRRALGCLRNVFHLFRIAAFSSKSNVVYLVPDGGLGLLYSLAYGWTAGLLRVPTVLHYRNYSYIDQYSWLMAWLLLAVRSNCVHVFLDEKMQADFVRQYAPRGRKITLSNAALVDVESDKVRRTDKLTVGLLSNLCWEKGFDDFRELVELAYARGCDEIAFRLAGAPMTQKDAHSLTSFLEKFPNVVYAGAVYGDEKRAFYESCDVIVFPTRFAQEAQPNVIWEAMACRCAVIAFGRGSISWMVAENFGHVVPPDGMFASEALDRLLQWRRAGDIADRHTAARSHFLVREQQANLEAAAFDSLLLQLAGSPISSHV